MHNNTSPSPPPPHLPLPDVGHIASKFPQKMTDLTIISEVNFLHRYILISYFN